MGGGGQEQANIAAYLQRGSDLFDIDQKAALAAYYQVVTLAPDHVEAWNQIGRLMFDLRQYSEAEMVFHRVESLSRQQGLDDWAEMAAQNAELTRETRLGFETTEAAEAASSFEPVNGVAANEPEREAQRETQREARSEAEPVAAAPAAQQPEHHQHAGAEPSPPIPDWAIATAAPGSSQPALPTNLRIDEMQIENIMARQANFAPAQPHPAAPQPPQPPLAQQQPPQQQPPHQQQPHQPQPPFSPQVQSPPLQAHQPVFQQQQPPRQQWQPPFPQQTQPPQPAESRQPAQQHSPQQHSPQQQQPAQTAASAGHAGAPQLASLDNLSAWPGPAAKLINPNQPPAPGARAHPNQPPAPPQAGLPPMGQAPQPPAFRMPQPGAQQMPHGAGSAPMPQMGNLAGIPRVLQPGQPVGSLADEVGEKPKAGAGKYLLITVAVIGIVGAGAGAALYLASQGSSDGGVPVIRSEAQTESKEATPSPEAPSASKESQLPSPQQADRDQAYTVGMNLLVNGKYDEGRSYLERAHELGHPEASYNLASMYAKGDGVPQDFDKVVKYLEKSVEGGYYPAMTNLGLLYAQGQGVPQDFLKSRDLWLKAAEGEHPDSMHNLAVIYATGKGVDKDMQEAIKWYRKAVNAGFVDSMANLGLVYANGDGVPQDFNEAKRLWEMAAGKGHEVAAQNLEKLNQIMAQPQQLQQ